MSGVAARIRQFLLGTYHDLPNIMFVGSLLIGAITGYLPLLWVSVGLLFNGINVAVLQGLLSVIFDSQKGYNQVYMRGNSAACGIIFPGEKPVPGRDNDLRIVAPSYWLASAVFFATFSIYNSIRIAVLPKVKGADADKADVRRAFTITTFVIGVIFLGLIMLRGFSGCETILGSILGVLVGGGGAVAFWHFLNACGTSMVPDILQVVNSMPPPGENKVPVVCAA